MIKFFRRKLSQQPKQDTILHVTITFSLKQRQIVASSGPIALLLTHRYLVH